MKKKTSNPTPFRAENLSRKIDDLRGVGPGELTHYFPRRRHREPERTSAPGVDPVRVKAAEGLGLGKGRRFFRAGQ